MNMKSVIFSDRIWVAHTHSGDQPLTLWDKYPSCHIDEERSSWGEETSDPGGWDPSSELIGVWMGEHIEDTLELKLEAGWDLKLK